MKFLVGITYALLVASESATAFLSSPAAFGTTRSPTQCNLKVDGRTINGDIQPTNNFVLIKKAQAQEQTGGGIILAGKAKIQKTEGSVVAVGPGRTHPETGAFIPMPVEPGEGVVYGKYDGTEIDIDGSKHTLIRDDDILVKFKGDQLTIDSAEVVRDNVLVRVETKDVSTEGGILIAKTSNSEKRPSTGEVMKVGPGRYAMNGDLMPMEVVPGDMVKFRDFAGNEVKIDDQEYSVVKMVDILAKF